MARLSPPQPSTIVPLLFLLICALAVKSEIRSIQRYQKSHHYPKTSTKHLEKSKLISAVSVSRTNGVWGEWSPWSPCSRSCGGGVTMQSRECIHKPMALTRSLRRKRLDAKEVGKPCVGLYKRFHLCNDQPCPHGGDFRTEQCSVFNKSPFKGRLYYWEPYLKAGECVLNCRALGMNFYAQLNRTVWDGTPCTRPLTHNMQLTPPGTRGICVQGECKSVSNEGVIGAISPPRTPELCSECSAGCKSESKFFLNPILKAGYNYVDRIPRGACRVTISQLKNTRNFIALQIASPKDGLYFLNGPNMIGQRSRVYAAGAEWVYTKQDSENVESITSSGPVQENVDIMLLYNQPNPGIKYEYMIPAESNSVNPTQSSLETRKNIGYQVSVDPRKNEIETRRIVENRFMVNQQNDDNRSHRRRRRKFVWKPMGLTQCTKSCGGGVQHPMLACIREHTQTQVLERRCNGAEKPFNQTLRCNQQPCPLENVNRPLGFGSRNPSYLPQPPISFGSFGSSQVGSGSGSGPGSGSKPYWGGTWSACSATCGPGEQTRVPVCMKDNIPTIRSACSDSTPITTRKCEVAQCDPSDNELEPTAAQWHTGGWSQCSVTCGTGQRSRSVTCSGQCSPQDKPSTVETCHGPPCSQSQSRPHHHHHHHGQNHHHQLSSITPSGPASQLTSSSQLATSSWLVSDWSESCSEECGKGSQSRWVTCPSGECSHSQKPETTRQCSSDKQCGGRWYTGPWGSCGDNCNGPARQKREVLCIAHIHNQIRIVSEMLCPFNDKPHTEQSCVGECPPRWHTGEWGKCEGPCHGPQGGTQTREVRCMDHQGKPAQNCQSDQVPQSKRNCQCQADYRFREMSQAQDEPSLDGDDCVNSIPNCTLIVQSRLCRSPVYYRQCCASCRRAGHFPNGNK